MIEILYENGENLAKNIHENRTVFGWYDTLCWTAIQNVVKKFELLTVDSKVSILYLNQENQKNRDDIP